MTGSNPVASLQDPMQNVFKRREMVHTVYVENTTLIVSTAYGEMNGHESCGL